MSPLFFPSITTGEFQSFVDITGYKPTAGRTFGHDETLEVIDVADRPNVPVHNVSFDDAILGFRVCLQSPNDVRGRDSLER
jgi:hypothetical protein